MPIKTDNKFVQRSYVEQHIRKEEVKHVINQASIELSVRQHIDDWDTKLQSVNYKMRRTSSMKWQYRLSVILTVYLAIVGLFFNFYFAGKINITGIWEKIFTTKFLLLISLILLGVIVYFLYKNWNRVDCEKTEFEEETTNSIKNVVNDFIKSLKKDLPPKIINKYASPIDDIEKFDGNIGPSVNGVETEA